HHHVATILHTPSHTPSGTATERNAKPQGPPSQAPARCSPAGASSPPARSHPDSAWLGKENPKRVDPRPRLRVSSRTQDPGASHRARSRDREFGKEHRVARNLVGRQAGVARCGSVPSRRLWADGHVGRAAERPREHARVEAVGRAPWHRQAHRHGGCQVGSGCAGAPRHACPRRGVGGEKDLGGYRRTVSASRNEAVRQASFANPAAACASAAPSSEREDPGLYGYEPVG
ncbi:hypothetical protein FN846DRAFT_1019563, partial [Sphaerosporella brunnea]